MYKTVYEGGTGEIVEKKSRFIATITPVESQEEAELFIESMRKKYWDARHNCFAYIIESNPPVIRCSDDGEPSQTAGKPMLDILTGESLSNIAVVVTRYFGGTLLGTGGLIRAYQGAVKEGLANCSIIEKQIGTVAEVLTDYNYLGKLQYLFAEDDVITLDTIYTDKVTCQIILTPQNRNYIEKKITESTNGTASVIFHDTILFAKYNGDILTFAT